MLIFGGSRETLGKGKDPIIGSSGREDTGIEDDKFMRICRVSHQRPRGKGSGKRGHQELGNTIHISSGYEYGEFMMNPWVSNY